MAYTDIPKEKLDGWWEENQATLLQTKDVITREREYWDAIATKVLLENEYKRRGWKTPADLVSVRTKQELNNRKAAS